MANPLQEGKKRNNNKLLFNAKECLQNQQIVNSEKFDY